MALTLTVVSRQSQSLGASAAKVFDRDGGTIGRAPSNDWVLPDPSKFVSSRHANIEVVGADYFVCDMSTNGTFVNGSVEAIGYGSKVRINHGDRIQIGEYELVATVGADQPGYAPPAGGPAPPGGTGPFDAGPSPFGAPPPPPPFGQSSPFGQGPPPAFEQSPPAPPPASDFSAGQSWPPPPPAPPAAPFDSEPLWDPDPSPGAGPQDPLEIMSNRGVGGRGTIGDIDDPSDRFRQAPPSGQGAWQDSGPLDEHFAVPPASPDAELPAGQIPSDWDKTTFPRQPDPVVPAAPSSMSAPGYSAQQLPNDWDAAPDPIAPSPRGAPAMPPMPPPAAPITPPVQRSAIGPAAGHRMPPPPPQPAYAYPDAGSGSAAVLQRILEGAGMDPAAAQVAVANPELTDTLGQILQIFVEGMMDVLRARSEVKDTFKLQHTVMKPVENNPLKFFPNGREALAALFTKQGSGYLSPVEATRQAFDDTKAHQMAMMAGMQAAFESLMKRFDPEVLQNEFDETGHGGMFKGRNKAKYWDGLVALYAKQMRNPDDSFRRLFGEPFAEAYEEQMQRLTNVRRRH